MQSLWNTVSSLWQPSDTVRFIVGKEEVGSFFRDNEDSEDTQMREFVVRKDIMIELSPVVSAAVLGEYKESVQQAISLPQFKPSDFESFVRLAQAVAFCDPPEIAVPVISDALVARVVPIAEYLGADRMLKMLEAHVQANATLKGMLAFEEANVPVQWSDGTFERLFQEVTIQQPGSTFYTQNNTYGSSSRFNMFRARAEAQKLSSLTVPTAADFIKFIVQRKCGTMQ